LGTKFKEFSVDPKAEDNTGILKNEYQDILATEDCFTFDVESPDPAERTWYYDSWGIKRRKPDNEN